MVLDAGAPPSISAATSSTLHGLEVSGTVISTEAVSMLVIYELAQVLNQTGIPLLVFVVVSATAIVLSDGLQTIRDWILRKEGLQI